MSHQRPPLARPSQNQPGQQVQQRQPKPIDLIRRQLDQMEGEFKVALPSHIPVDRFKRIVITAINTNEDLLFADRKSLFGACMKAAQDGLLPDGREGALVIYNTKVKRQDPETGLTKEMWIKQVQWMPMVGGLIKKARNTGEIVSITARVVYQNDHFRYVLGDDEKIEHEPIIDGDPGPFRAAYSIVKLKDGTIQREVLTKAKVDKLRAASKSKDGPAWVTWYDEMARAKATRQCLKWVPTSTELEDMVERADIDSVVNNHMEWVPGVDDHDGPEIEGTATHVEAEAGEAPAAVEHREEAEFKGPAGEERQPEPAQQQRRSRAAKPQTAQEGSTEAGPASSRQGAEQPVTQTGGGVDDSMFPED